MKKIATFFALLFLAISGNAQDLALASPSGSITSPVSGCALTTTEVVTVSIFNFGPTLPAGSTFNVSYTVNGGAPVTELVTLASNFLTNGSFVYSFATTTDLSVAGTYTLTSTVSLAGDVNGSNDTFVGYNVTNAGSSVGGTVSGGMHVCKSLNSGFMTLSGQTGSIVQWEFSTDNISYLPISNTTTSQSYTNVSVKTYYRVKVQNGGCPAVFSSVDSLLIDPTTVAGTVAAAATKCITDNATYTLTLSGKTGNVIRWESSTNNFVTTTVIPNVTTTQTYIPSVLGVTTKFRAVVQSGACASATTAAITITIAPLSVGGTLSPLFDTVCAPINAGTLTLAGKTGTVVRWEFSTNNGVTWTNVANTTTSLTFTNITVTRLYRVRIQSSPCSVAYSDTARITVIPASAGGTATPSTSVCGGSSGTINLIGETGSVVDWEQSTDGGSTWFSLGNTTTSQTYTNIAATTLYHAIVQSGSCGALATSIASTITVTGSSVGGTVSTNTTVCSGNNNGTLTLSGQAGSVTNWLSSTDNGVTWTNVANTTASLTYNNIIDTTWYVAVVQNSTCPKDSSDTVIVTTDPATVGGYVDTSASACFGNNSDTLLLKNSVGSVLNWEFSTDNGSTWLSIVNATDSLFYNNLISTTMYHALVKSGVCPAIYSSSATIVINQPAAGGTAYGATTVCQSGNAGTITLVGFNSSVLNWESSIDNGVTWLPIVNTTPLENYSNLTQTTSFRAIVTAGGCANDTSSIAIISVDSVTIPGSVTLDDTVCAGQNAGILNLSGNTGTVTGWEMSTDGGTTWISLGNTTSSQGYNNLNVTTAFRTEVKNGVCAAAGSAAATITVDQSSNAGTISSNATVCQTYNGGTLVLSGVNGNVTDWQVSSDNGATWISLANVTNQQAYSSLIDTTWYIAIAVNGVCAADTSTPAVITVIPKPNASFTKNDTCFGLPIKFTNTTTVTGGYVQLYTWDFADNSNSTAGSPTHTYADTGTYMVSLVALSNFGCLDTFTLATTVRPVPSVAFTLSGPTTFCTGDSLVIMEPFDPNNTYSWSTGSTHDTLTVDTTGTWVLHVTNSVTGCSGSDSVSTVLVPSLVADAGLSDTISIGNSITLNGSGGTNYSWSPAGTLDIPTIANPVASPTTTTMYYLTVSSNGCTSKDSVQITVEPKYDFEISTVITPNGDGYNDFWYIKNITFYPDNEVIIFNRYGQKVFSMTGYDNSWTGTSPSGNLPDGTYYYVLKFTSTDKSFNGGITVLRSK